MPLWICLALLSAAVATFLIRNVNSSGVETSGHAPDLDVYRDQLAELESDAERGVIEPGEAKAARVEIARRLIKQSEAGQPSTADTASTAFSANLLKVSAAVIPAVSLLLYLAIGSPGLPGRPLAERIATMPTREAAPEDLIAKVEARLREKPDDGAGWEVIAPVYLSTGRPMDAAQAFSRAISLLGENPERLLGLAKANVMLERGIVNEAAHKALQRTLELEPERFEARFWLAVYDEQNGRLAEAAAIYADLLKKAPPGAPWRSSVEERLAVVTGQAVASPKPQAQPVPGGKPPELAPAGGTGSGKGPSPAEFVAAAQKLAPEMRSVMIGKMITRATEAAVKDPKNAAIWTRIVTGHTALGNTTDAKAALQEARKALSADPAGLSELDALETSLGLKS